MKDILLVIEQRVHKINTIPYAKESLRLGSLLDRMAALSREMSMMSMMGEGTGMHDLLIEIAALCVAWVEFRRPPGAKMVGPGIGHA